MDPRVFDIWEYITLQIFVARKKRNIEAQHYWTLGNQLADALPKWHDIVTSHLAKGMTDFKLNMWQSYIAPSIKKTMGLYISTASQ